MAEAYNVFAGQYLEDWNLLDQLQKNLEADIEAEESAAEIYKNFVQNKNNFKKYIKIIREISSPGNKRIS